MTELTLYGESSWVSPWVFHVLVALEELGKPYKLELLPLPIPAQLGASLAAKAVLPKVPCLVHGDLWLTESSAITEYLAETFPEPRLLPAEPMPRARARQVMSWLRTSLQPLREERPTTSVFQRPVRTPLTDKAREHATELIRVAEKLLPVGASHLFGAWSIADADLALALMRLIANEDSVPARLADYALGQWSRASVRKYLSYIPTNR
ncbi:MAG TPA: glutathione transferase [Kofleriaceae bacterium]|nr:glutathione transferase [Kofleriaceae bacterium]